MTQLPEVVEGAILTPALAQEIAGDTSTIIGLNIIITDAAGIVLGSGDRTRVGSFHEASLSVVEHRREESHDAREAARLQGVRPGMTLPIVHQDVVVGTVGITGTPDQVLRFGQVVKRQTEILLEEGVLVRTRMTRERVLESLLRDLLTHDPDQPADVATRARDFGLDLRVARRTLVFDLEADAGSASTLTSPLRVLREAFRHPQDVSGSLSPSRCVVLEHTTAPGPGIDAKSLSALSDDLARGLGGRCVVGIGGPAEDEAGISRSYADALTALRLGPVAGLVSPYDIEALRGHEMLLAVPSRARQRIAASTLGALRTDRDWETVRTTVIAFVEHGFALVAAARALQIHRNTLVYRLGRISERSGVAQDDRRGWLALYLACVADLLDAS
jgi:carbohydrate diacid regulator